MKEFMNLFLFIAICFLIYILFRNFFFLFLIFSEAYSIIFPTGDSIGHGAHLLGTLFGLLYFLYQRNFDHPE